MLTTLFFTLVLFGLLMALARIDARHMILPNGLNALVALTGLAQSLVAGDPDWREALAAALIAGGLMYAVAYFYRRVRGVDGLGLGDVKLAAAGGMWIGVDGVAPMLLIASLSAAAVIGLRAWRKGVFDAREKFPFGPFLALGVAGAWALRRCFS